MSSSWIFGLILFQLLSQVVEGNSLTFGKVADQKCSEVGKTCDPEYTCALRQIIWPMNMSFPVCVLKRNFPVKMHICELPPEEGNCGARFMRWYYNRYSHKCTLFKYQGCDGNMNNFKTRAECQASCYHRNTLQNDAFHDPRALAVSRPQIVSEPEYITHYNKVSTRSRKRVSPEKDRRRKRRLQKQKRKRLKKLRRRRKRKGYLNKKRRREGKNPRDRRGKKYRHRKRNKKNKKRKHRKKKNKKRKSQRNKQFEIIEGGTDFHSDKTLTTSTTVIPDIKKKQYDTDLKKKQYDSKKEKEKKKQGMTLYSILAPKTPTPTAPSIVER